MNAKKMFAIVCAAGMIGGAFADDAKPEAEVEESNPLDGLVSAEFHIGLDSRYMTYGMIDGKDPIVVPGASITFFDWVYFGVEAIFDVTKGNGKRGGYGNRAGRWTTLDSMVGLAHDFDLGDTLGALSVDVSYMYEYIERYHSDMGDTQYINLELSLGDLWFEPTLAIERDIMADDGTYVNFEVGHEFALIDGDGEDDDPLLAFRPSVGQGFGNTQRVRGYSPEDKVLDHGGVMDTCIKGEFTWNVCDHVSLSAYIAYSDYWFDSNMRDCARGHNAEWGHAYDRSWNIYGGVGLSVEF